MTGPPPPPPPGRRPPPPPPGFGTPPPVPSPAAPAQAMARAQVHDVRFQGYRGERTPSWQAPLVLAWWSILRAFGRRRGWSAKFVPFALLGLAFIPGMGVLTVRALLSSNFPGQELPIELLPYSNYLGMIGTLIVLWTALVTPELICPDMQYRVTSLYFATAVSPTRYVLGKWLASMVAMTAMTVLPTLMLFLGNVMFAPSVWDALKNDADAVPRIIAGGLLVAAYFSSLGLAIAALTGRRAYAVGALVGLVLGSAIVAGALQAAGFERLGAAVNLVAVPIQLAQRLFRDNDISVPSHALAYAAVVLLSLAVMLVRFRRQP